MKEKKCKYSKQKSGDFGVKDFAPFVLSLFVAVVLTKWIEKTCLNTLLPFCFPWMYYQFVLIILFVLLESIRGRCRKYIKKIKNGTITSFIVSYKSVILLIIIPALFLLPNRYIQTDSEVEYKGVVIDNTTWAMTRTASWSNYVKIRIEDLNTSFWCDVEKVTQPIGTKCTVSVRRGIFRMRYVEDVRFLVE